MKVEYDCPDGVAEIATDDASLTGFSPEDAWSFLESTPRSLDLTLQETDVPGTSGHYPGDLTITRAHSPVYFVEDWGWTSFECKDRPMIRVPTTLHFASSDGAYVVDGPVSFDLQALTLADTWFMDGNSGPVPSFPSEEIQDIVHAVEGHAGAESYSMNFWTHLDAGQSSLGAEPSGTDGDAGIGIAMGEWTVGT